MKTRIWLLTLLLAASAFAQETPPFDLTTLSGKKYLGVTVTRVEGDAIAINHDDGTARVYFADLPPELRTKYGYDPNKPAAAVAQRAEAMARQREIDAKNMEAEKQLKAAPFQQGEKEQAAKRAAGDTPPGASPRTALPIGAASSLNRPAERASPYEMKQLVGPYIKNPLSADATFKGKTITFIGNVSEIDTRGKPTLVFESKSESTVFGVHCELADDAVAGAEKIKKGRRVQVTGVVTGLTRHYVTLENCHLVQQ